MADRLLTDSELAALLGRSRSTIQKDRLAGRGCPYVKLGRLVRYKESVVQRYVAGLPERHSTSEADAGEAPDGP